MGMHFYLFIANLTAYDDIRGHKSIASPAGVMYCGRNWW
jgi:hypothetical protein